MTEETEGITPQETPEQKPVAAKPAVAKPNMLKPSGNPFAGKAGGFQKGKMGSQSFKGKIFKGSGVKKGK